MQLIRGIHNLRPAHRAGAVTIGNFDGLHRGHQAVLRKLHRHAGEQALITTVMVFEPTPQEYFSPSTAPARLQRLRDKLAMLSELGVDQVICLPFNRHLAQVSAGDFVREVLIDKLDVRFLVVGDDFRFGKGREGDFPMLQACGRQSGFDVVSTDTFVHSDERVSSTRIREALARGDLALAGKLLGRPFNICGRVSEGQKRGRTIGFPTANIRLHRVSSPLRGVFAVRVSGLADRPLAGVANIGTRPTVDGSYWVLEVHLFDFSADVYGKNVNVEFHSKLRDEMKFDSFDALKEQIEKDAAAARKYFEQL